jgi:glutathione S-transferase
MDQPVTVIGAPASPYVRKVLAALEIKGVPYRLDPVVPFYGNEEFTRLSPLRRVPVLIDGDLVLPDSTVICEYLDERHPATALMPRGLADRARVRWLEEFADTRMGDVLVWGIFGGAVVRPGVFKQPRDEAPLARLVAEELPTVMDYLESVAPIAGFYAGDLTVADLAVAAPFANLRWSNVSADLSRWPRAAAWIARVEASEPLARLNRFAERAMTTRAPDRAALFAEFGMSLAENSVAGREARRGPMSSV